MKSIDRILSVMQKKYKFIMCILLFNLICDTIKHKCTIARKSLAKNDTIEYKCKKMSAKKIICLLLALSLFASLFVIPSLGVSTVYDRLSAEPAVYTAQVTFDTIKSFYSDRTTDEILSDAENNYMYGGVTVAGAEVMSHVYMRTFSITNISLYTAEAANERISHILGDIKSAVGNKYLKCIARQYSISVNAKQDKKTGKYTSMTMKIFIAVGESNAQRKEVIDTFVAPNVSAWEGLGEGERIQKLNALLLGGRFRYDMTLKNRSSVYEFVKDGLGVCEEYAALTSLFLDHMGYENAIITGTVGTVGHMWNTVCINGRYYHLDILWDGPVNGEGVHTSVNEKYLLVSTQSISATHTPSESFSALCEKARYNYAFGQTPTQIETRLYEITDGKIMRVPILTTVEFLVSSLELDGFIVVMQNGVELAPNELVGSGCTVQLNVNGVVLQSLTACVLGDCTGDGRTSREDIQYLHDVILGRAGADAPLADMCDVNEDGAVTLSDVFIFKNLMHRTYKPDEPVLDTPIGELENQDGNEINAEAA